MRQSKVRFIFLTRLWAFLNYRTRVRLTWLELLTASGVGLMFVWVGLRNWNGLALVGPFALYIFLLGFYRELRSPVAGVRALHRWLFKPPGIKPEPNKKYYALAIIAALVLVAIALAFLDIRLALLFALVVFAAAILFWAIDERETAGGTVNLHTAASRIPIQAILENGEIVQRDGTRSRISLITFGRSAYKPALNAVDVSDSLTKFLAYLAQHEDGGLPIKLFWLTDYHLGQLDLSDADHVSPEYLAELRDLTERGARKARVIITGIVYPAQVEGRIRDWLGHLDFNLSPLGAFAVESLIRMLFGNESFLAQIQQAGLTGAGALPRVAYRGFVPENLVFGEQLCTNRNVLNVTRVNTPFPDARDALMRALHSVDGMLSVTVTPLPRDSSATEIRGQLLAARVPGLGHPKEARALREILEKLENPRGLEYLFDTQTHLITWGSDERTAQKNQTLAASYLTALNLTPLTRRKLEDSLGDWLPVLSMPHAHNRYTRIMNWLTAPPRAPGQRLLSAQAISMLEIEEGSDIYLADARGRILLGRSIGLGKEGLRYADFRSDTGPVLLVSDQGGGKTSTLIVWFILRLFLSKYKIIALNLKYSTRMQAAVEKNGGIVLHPGDDVEGFEECVRDALFSDRAVIYQPVKGTRPYAIADDPCLLAFMRIFYEEWLPRRDSPAALVIDEIHRLMPKDSPLSASAAQVATMVVETFKDWAERKLVIAAATQTLRDLMGSNLGVALQKFRTVAYFQVGPEDREMLIEKGYEPALMNLIVGARRRPRGYCVLVMPDGFYTTVKVLVTPDEREIIQRLDVEETADVTPQLAFK